MQWGRKKKDPRSVEGKNWKGGDLPGKPYIKKTILIVEVEKDVKERVDTTLKGVGKAFRKE